MFEQKTGFFPGKRRKVMGELDARIELGVAGEPFLQSRDGVPAAAAKLDTVSKTLATRFLDADFDDADLSDRFLLSAWSTLSRSDFTAEDILTSSQPITVYLRWPETDLPRLAPLVRLLWGSLVGELISAYDRKKGANCHPVLCLIDEAGQTAIPSLSDYATTVCGRGITLWISIQSLSQLDVKYGTKRAKVLRDNMETQVFYRPSDFDTAKHLEDRLGRRSMYARQTTERDGSKLSHGLSEQGIPLMTAQEIMRMPDKDILLSTARFPRICQTHGLAEHSPSHPKTGWLLFQVPR